MGIDFLKAQRFIQSGNYYLSDHAEEERQADKITVQEIKEALQNCELLENYPDDPRGASILVMGYTSAQKPVHLVLGEHGARLIIITVYLPHMPKWTNERTRNRPEGLES
jgi:hypothetical protein